MEAFTRHSLPTFLAQSPADTALVKYDRDQIFCFWCCPTCAQCKLTYLVHVHDNWHKIGLLKRRGPLGHLIKIGNFRRRSVLHNTIILSTFFKAGEIICWIHWFLFHVPSTRGVNLIELSNGPTLFFFYGWITKGRANVKLPFPAFTIFGKFSTWYAA